MANGTLKVQNIETSSGSGTITLGQSGETINFPSGVNITNSGNNQLNYPAFRAFPNANQSASSGAYNLVYLQTVDYDTDNAFDNSGDNYKFTVPSGKAGKYVFHYSVSISSGDNKWYIGTLYVNGVRDDRSRQFENTGTGTSSVQLNATYNVDLSVGDYVQLYLYHNTGSSKNIQSGSTYFSGYRIGD